MHMFSHDIGPDLVLRLLEERHSDQLFALTDKNRAYLREWLPWVDSTTSPDDTRGFIRHTLQQLAENDGFQAGIWFRGQLVGVIGFHGINWNNKKTEIGYWLSADFQGQGIMTLCCGALVQYAFEELGLNRVEIRCATGNAKSCAIPERLGFTREGVAREAEWLYDRFVDQAVYGMLAREWKHK
jgi:ribosomal-protein-serine acetyltransferase